LVEVRELDIKLYADKYLVKFREQVRINSAAPEPYTVLEWTPYELFANQNALEQSVALDSTTTIAIRAKSNDGCIGEAAIEIAVMPNILMPNAFTPNGDGINDRFHPASSGFILIRNFEVYNRLGQIIYSAFGAGATEGWDGTLNGKPCDMGTYFYQLHMETAHGEIIHLKGDVSLIR
jgi:gliding motility-associated-like protein